MPHREFSVSRFVMIPPGIFIARLHGPNRFSVSVENAHKLCERFGQGGLNALLIDYSDCVLGHQPHEYRQIAEAFASGLPAGLPFAYVYRQEQAAHIMIMTRTLNAAGLKARGFEESSVAENWLLGELGTPAGEAGTLRALDPPAENPAAKAAGS